MIATGFPNQATPLGSTPYYVTRFSPGSQQDNIAALFLFKLELNKLYALRDPGVARIKLQWWQQQISLPLSSPSNHPLASQLSQMFHQSDTAAAALETLIAAKDHQLHRQPYPDSDALWQACQDIGGSFGQLLAQFDAKPTDPQHLQQLGAWCVFTEWLQDLGRLVRDDVRLLPLNALKTHGLGFDNLLQPDNRPAVQTLLSGLLADFKASQPLPKLPRSKTAFVRYVRIRMKLLKLLEQEKFDVMHQRISLTPIRKLWVAW